ncbi:MAG: DUF3473 domain-containing protein [Betaproteobacteria bacterium]
MMPEAVCRPQHAFTVDVEEWYHPLRFYKNTVFQEQARLDVGMDCLLGLLDARGIRATFFWVAEVAAANPGLLRRLAAAGHEIGCHGLAHDRLVYDLTPDRFRVETTRALDMIADLTGHPITAYRAPCFSITARSLWALDILADLGITVDSSIFPVHNWRYGIPEWPDGPQRIGVNRSLWEVPMSTRSIAGYKIPAVGGAYFRLYPYWLTAANLLHLEAKGQWAVFYIHPWELDPAHPFVAFNWKACTTHYLGLSLTENRLRRLLSEFSFTTLGSLVT